MKTTKTIVFNATQGKRVTEKVSIFFLVQCFCCCCYSFSFSPSSSRFCLVINFGNFSQFLHYTLSQCCILCCHRRHSPIIQPKISTFLCCLFDVVLVIVVVAYFLLFLFWLCVSFFPAVAVLVVIVLCSCCLCLFMEVSISSSMKYSSSYSPFTQTR